MDTINTIEFAEEVSQEDTSFNVEENSQEQDSVDSVESMEEATTQEEEPSQEETRESDVEEESLDMEQIPIGTDTIMCERNGDAVEGQQLVFTNPDTDLPVQTINELDSKDLDDEVDGDFKPENIMESASQEEDEACEDSDRESVDGDDLDGVVVRLGAHKLVFPNEEEAINEDDTEEEVPVAMNEKEYVEEEDPDFNPAYCGETLSDCDEDQEGENEPTPEMIRLTGDTCIMKCENMLIPPTENMAVPVGPPAVTAEAPMDCE